MTSNFSLKVVLAGMMLGFPLSLLFFMDQNIAESMVNSPDNKLVKVFFKAIFVMMLTQTK